MALLCEDFEIKDRPLCNETVEDYTKAWSEQIDRGLYHVKPEVSTGVTTNILTIMMLYITIGVQTALDGGENNDTTSQREKSFGITGRRHQ